MTARTTAEIVAALRERLARVAELQEHLKGLSPSHDPQPDPLDTEAADRLAELDIRVDKLRAACARYEATLRRRDALRPPCPTCGGTGESFDLICDNCGASASLPLGQTCSNHLAKPQPCPDCVDGKVSIERLVAVFNAVHGDVWYQGASSQTATQAYTYLRAIR